MQGVDGNILIRKLDDYIKTNGPLIEIEVTSLYSKRQFICNEFGLSVNNLLNWTVVKKLYFSFIVLEIRNENEKLVGARLVTDSDDVYQISSVDKVNNDGNLVNSEEYLVKRVGLNLLVKVQNYGNGQENISVIEFDKINDKNLSCSFLKETAIVEIQQIIEKNLGYDNMKIYQIHRTNTFDFEKNSFYSNNEELSGINFNQDEDKIISYSDKCKQLIYK